MTRLVRFEYMLQKELEKEIKKVADRQAELSADVQTMRRDLGTEFDKYNSSQSVFRKQLLQVDISNIRLLLYGVNLKI